MKITDHKRLSDAELVNHLEAGDKNALTAIFERYRALLFLFTFRRLTDKEASKDLIYEVFSEIWQNRQNIDIDGDLQLFLVTVIKNKLLNYFKHNKPSQQYLDNFNEYLQKPDNSPPRMIRHTELSTLIDKEIAALPEQMRQVYELSRKKALGNKEIAVQLNISEEKVKEHIYQAMGVLRKHLGLFLF